MSVPKNRLKSDVKHEIVLYARNVDYQGTFSVELAGETLPYNKYFIPRHLGAPYVFEYVLSGKGYIEADGVKHPIKAGDFYMVSDYSRLDYYSDYDDPYRKIYVNCRGTLNRHLCQAYDLDYPYYIYPFPKAEKYIRTIHNILCNPHLDLHAKDSTCAQIIQKMLSDLNAEISFDSRKPNADLAYSVKTYLDKNICEKVNLDEVIKNFFISKTRLITLFQENFGISPYQYLVNQRINMACSFLKNSNLSIREITEMLQFSDAHYFSSFFKSKIGCSPTEYRNKTFKNNQK